eukprot:scaffold6998_cov57-Attheya_sp.AAC.3
MPFAPCCCKTIMSRQSPTNKGNDSSNTDASTSAQPVKQLAITVFNAVDSRRTDNFPEPDMEPQQHPCWISSHQPRIHLHASAVPEQPEWPGELHSSYPMPIAKHKFSPRHGSQTSTSGKPNARQNPKPSVTPFADVATPILLPPIFYFPFICTLSAYS